MFSLYRRFTYRHFGHRYALVHNMIGSASIKRLYMFGGRSYHKSLGSYYENGSCDTYLTYEEL